jgi:hypothetical protein
VGWTMGSTLVPFSCSQRKEACVRELRSSELIAFCEHVLRNEWEKGDRCVCGFIPGY